MRNFMIAGLIFAILPPAYARTVKYHCKFEDEPGRSHSSCKAKIIYSDSSLSYQLKCKDGLKLKTENFSASGMGVAPSGYILFLPHSENNSPTQTASVGVVTSTGSSQWPYSEGKFKSYLRRNNENTSGPYQEGMCKVKVSH